MDTSHPLGVVSSPVHFCVFFRLYISIRLFLHYIMASRESLVKHLGGTSEKLNGTNYLLWFQGFETFCLAHQKLKHLTQPLPDSKDATYDNWCADDAAIVT